ncbi:zinc ABC transporter substrate-binding protein [Candidatus Peregrinibacteria bacterium]|nr:zinc ABC transporter substrate-binding protein [Candidatus Peregrinibacteria bacterium]
MNKKWASFFIGILLISSAGYALVTGIFRAAIPIEIGKPKLRVITSFYPLYYFAGQIGGDKAVIINIAPAGAEPHDYEPTAQDMAQIEDSQLVILNGLNLEPWGKSISQNTRSKNATIIMVGETLAIQPILKEDKNSIDPHVWLSPVLAMQMVDKIADGFVKVDPKNASFYTANASALKLKLDQLDAEYKQGLGQCAQRDIVTSHAAFGYLAKTYHFNQIAISGLSPDAEPLPRQFARIVDAAKKNKVRFIFFESLVSPKLSEALANEIGAKTLVLNPIEGLSDRELAQGKNYFTEMEINLAHLQTALECKI